MDLKVKGFLETSFVDWDGKIVSVVYLPLCNFNCPFCHNYDLAHKHETFEDVPLDKIEQFLIERKDFIDGICITGGEPCMHGDRGLVDFIKRVKSQGFRVKLDTNGSFPDVIRTLLAEKLVDFIAMDIKGPLDERYDKLSGAKTDLEKIKESIKIIMESGAHYEFRTTVVPGFLDIKDIEDLAKGIKGANMLVLQQFVQKNAYDEGLKGTKPYSKEKLVEMMEIAKPYVQNVKLRGI